MRLLWLLLAVGPATPTVIQNPKNATRQVNTTTTGVREELNVSATINGLSTDGGTIATSMIDGGAPASEAMLSNVQWQLDQQRQVLGQMLLEMQRQTLLLEQLKDPGRGMP